jgi:hypothetical protein
MSCDFFSRRLRLSGVRSLDVNRPHSFSQQINLKRRAAAMTAKPVVRKVLGSLIGIGCLGMIALCRGSAGDESEAPPRACIDGSGPGWTELGEADFAHVNGADDTWQFRPGGIIHCTGVPNGVLRTSKVYTNFEFVAQWRHLRVAGNSGFFVWTPPEALEGLKPGALPKGGVEVQALENGYVEQYEKKSGKKADFFTTHGDVFAVGTTRLKPFPPLSPNGSRSFPRKRLSRGVDQWNHYYVRCINGEVRLWVNGEEVSGGTGCVPASGSLCLESEGSPVEFKQIRIRELP